VRTRMRSACACGVALDASGGGSLVGVPIVPARPCWLRVATHDQAEDRLRCRRVHELVAANEGWNGRGRRLCCGAGRARAREPWREAVRCAAWRSPQGFPLASVKRAANGCASSKGRFQGLRECRGALALCVGSSVIVRGSCVVLRSLFARIDRWFLSFSKRICLTDSEPSPVSDRCPRLRCGLLARGARVRRVSDF
jgi:hypothetical protein